MKDLEIGEHLGYLVGTDDDAPMILTAYCMQKKYDHYFKGLYFSRFLPPVFMPQQPPLEGLLNAVRKDAYYPFLTAPDSAASVLNRLLECPDFFEMVCRKKGKSFLSKIMKPENKLQKKQRGREPLLKELIDRTNAYRNKEFKEFTPDERYWIIRLNRTLLERLYPKLTPKRRMELNPFFEWRREATSGNEQEIEVSKNFLITYIYGGRDLLKSGELKLTLSFLLNISKPPENMDLKYTENGVAPYISCFVYRINECFEVFWKEHTGKQKTGICQISEQSLQQYLVEKLPSFYGFIPH